MVYSGFFNIKIHIPVDAAIGGKSNFSIMLDWYFKMRSFVNGWLNSIGFTHEWWKNWNFSNEWGKFVGRMVWTRATEMYYDGSRGTHGRRWSSHVINIEESMDTLLRSSRCQRTRSRPRGFLSLACAHTLYPKRAALVREHGSIKQIYILTDILHIHSILMHDI